MLAELTGSVGECSAAEDGDDRKHQEDATVGAEELAGLNQSVLCDGEFPLQILPLGDDEREDEDQVDHCEEGDGAENDDHDSGDGCDAIEHGVLAFTVAWVGVWSAGG